MIEGEFNITTKRFVAHFTWIGFFRLFTIWRIQNVEKIVGFSTVDVSNEKISVTHSTHYTIYWIKYKFKINFNLMVIIISCTCL